MLGQHNLNALRVKSNVHSLQTNWLKVLVSINRSLLFKTTSHISYSDEIPTALEPTLKKVRIFAFLDDFIIFYFFLKLQHVFVLYLDNYVS